MPSAMWGGLACSAVGLAFLGYQVYMYLAIGLLHSMLIGGGIALVGIGAMTLFYSFDDRRTRGR